MFGLALSHADCPRRASRRQLASGFTLVELMIGLVLGLLIVIAVSSLFVSSSTTRREVELSADVIENGRYAVDLMGRELSQSGFYGTIQTVSGATNSPCSTTVTDLEGTLAIHVAAFNSKPSSSVSAPACLNDIPTSEDSAKQVNVKADTDVIFIQRLSTCFVGEVDSFGVSVCDALSDKKAYLQVSECFSKNPGAVIVAEGVAAKFTFETKSCDGATSARRELIRRFFFIDGDNVLRYADITLDGAQPAVALVENIEQMQIEYGIDDMASGAAGSDGSIDRYTSTPSDTELPQVLGVRLWLLARSSDLSKNTNGAMSFEMGDFQGGDLLTFASADRNPKRRVYSTFISFTTPKARVEK